MKLQSKRTDIELMLSREDKINIKNRTLNKQLDLLNKNLMLGLPASLLCAIVVFILLRPTSAGNLLWGWFAAVVLISLFRLSAFYYYRRSPEKNSLHLSIFTIGAALSAALWGFAGSILMPDDNIIVQMIIFTIIAGITSGSIQTTQANLFACLIFVIFALLPVTLWFFFQNEYNYIFLGLVATLYLFFMLSIAWRGNKLLNKSLELLYQNLALVGNLSSMNMQLQVNEESLRNIQENAPIGMAIISLDEKWLQVNRALCEIVGYDKTELTNLTTKEITYPEDTDSDLTYQQKLLEGKLTSYQIEKRFIHKNGKLIWTSVSRSLIRDKEGKPFSYISQIQNINERKQNETIMSDLNERTNSMLKELRQREHEMAMITKMNDMLQSCHESNEAFLIINLAAKKLFPQLNGGLCIFQESANNMKTVEQWNRHRLSEIFTIEECWALRNGYSYNIEDAKHNIICQHFKSTPGSYICLPLIIQSGAIGMFHLNAQKRNGISAYQQQLASTFSEVIRLALANIQLREKLREQAIRDPLTELVNRRYLNETLPRELQRIIREKSNLCVAMLDIDHFKRFNDTHGHEAGDQVLKFIGTELRTYFRGSDMACRFGGEEFLVMLLADLKSTVSRMQSLREDIKQARVYYKNILLPQITVSIGIAEAPTHGSTAEEIIRCADDALYSAKRLGRDRVETYLSKEH